MLATYAVQDAIFSILSKAQTTGSGLPFTLSPSIELYNFQPGDFVVDAQSTRDSIYLYFDKTRFDSGDGDPSSQTHYPRLHIDLYTSTPATRDGEGVVSESLQVADLAMRSMAVQIYAILKNSQFIRLMDAEITGRTWNSHVEVTDAIKIGVLRLSKSKKAIACFRFVVAISVTEKHGTATGIDLSGYNDTLIPFRQDES